MPVDRSCRTIYLFIKRDHLLNFFSFCFFSDLHILYFPIRKDILKAASPIFHVDSIRVPLFVAQGANDPRVKQAESDQIVEALKAKGVEVPYMLKEDEGHGFYNEENQFDFYREMEKFLKKHIG